MAVVPVPIIGAIAIRTGPAPATAAGLPVRLDRHRRPVLDGAMATNLELEPDELDAVREVLTSAISDLSPEIAGTDNFEYREAPEGSAGGAARRRRPSRRLIGRAAPPGVGLRPPRAGTGADDVRAR